MHSPTLRLLLAIGLLGLTACDPPTNPIDAAPLGDAGPGTDTPGTDTPRLDTPPAAGSCDDIRTVTLTEGANTINGDTTGLPMDLVLTCDPFMAAPQEVLQVTLPGTAADTYGLILNTENGAATAFDDTLIEVRTSCASDIDAICSDDVDFMGGNARTNFTASFPGGTTLFIVLSGYGPDNVGAWQIDATLSLAHPPTITSGTALIIGDSELRLSVEGADVDGDAVGVVVDFLDAAGVSVDASLANGDLVADLLLGFDPSVDGMTTFTGEVVLTGIADIATAATVQVRLVDATDLESATSDLTPTRGVFVARGEACDDAATFCPQSLTCDTGTCVIPAAVLTACMTQTPVVIATPTDTTTSTNITTTIVPGDGDILATCQANTPGDESLFSLTVPAGAFDLLVITAGTVTGATDTVAYLMSTCGDTSEGGETYCSDDVDFAGGDASSALEIRDIPAGDYTIALEAFGTITAGAAIGATVSLRPVLATAAACDDTGVMNRCAAGPCAASVCP